MICYFLVVTINFLKEKTTICHYFVNIFFIVFVFYYLSIINIVFPLCFFLYENFTGRNRRKCSLFCLTLIKITYTSPNHGFMVTGKEKFEKLRD
ncbi:BAI_1a_G0013240.mRNA.1.CDS.1 [Saccharomyces cerevisiae]|nr:BAI_1a_G0013240.mRNA.1.CDS.1 [Saccharomyces cerevisiae]CAI7085251.1 BAI_1a_G0013240.mRNA.1.CDS.1 [Saccharomyces cerevisiae]